MTLDEIRAGMTPGPWRNQDDDWPPEDNHGNPMPGFRTIAAQVEPDIWMAVCEHVKPADAALIALAPAMLDAVEALRGVMRFALPITHHDVEDFNRARAALAKIDAATVS